MSSESPARFEIAKVLARSVATLRERWLTLAALVLGLHFIPSLAVGLMIKRNLRPASYDPAALAIYVAVALGPALLRCFSNAAVASASLSRTRTLVPAVVSVIAAAPALLPIWLMTQYVMILHLTRIWPYAFGLWAARHHMSGAVFGLGIFLVQFVPFLVAVAALGVVTPVVLAERRALPAALGRTWRLMRGNRWKVLALYMLVVVGVNLVSLLEPAINALIAGRVEGIWLNETLSWAMTAILDLMGAFWGALTALSYLELRRVAEGEPLEEVVEHFA
jgi:hypothetical protein